MALLASFPGGAGPPTAPSGLSATVVTSPSKKVNLSWTGSTDNVGVTGYKIYRNGSLIGTSSSTSYTDSSVSAGATYSYEVAAYDEGYNISSVRQVYVCQSATD